jgi:hypothetical protein
MPIVIDGDGTVSGISVGGLPDGIVDAGTLATNSVDSAELIDGSIDTSHLAANQITSAILPSNISDSGTEGTKIAVGTTGQRGSTTGQWRFNSTTGLFEGYDGTSFNTLPLTPTVSSVDDTEVDSAGGGNQTIVVTGTNFAAGGIIAFVGATAVTCVALL